MKSKRALREAQSEEKESPEPRVTALVALTSDLCLPHCGERGAAVTLP